MSIELRVAANCQPTGRILAELLRERGLSIVNSDGDAVVNYGVKYTGSKPALNANSGGRTKLDELGILVRRGIRTVPVWVPKVDDGSLSLEQLGGDYRNDAPTYPLLARKETHMHGKDIMPVFQPEELSWRMAAGAAFFTEYIPRLTEYRLWVYRKRHLGAYEKEMVYPDKYRFIGCNYRNGFAFKFVPFAELPNEAFELASKSVAAMELDFGAVDILKGKDGRFYVLEVNTAPGVAGLTREGIKKLADKIKKWVDLGYVRRGS
jgi:hypothetical protein